MGRLRIKRKDAVIPFRKTMAYRLLLATGSLIILLFAVYFIFHYVQVGNNTGIVVAVLGSVMAVTSLFYNLGEVRNAKVPTSTLKRARRR
jgi:hypothetical protein